MNPERSAKYLQNCPDKAYILKLYVVTTVTLSVWEKITITLQNQHQLPRFWVPRSLKHWLMSWCMWGKGRIWIRAIQCKKKCKAKNMHQNESGPKEYAESKAKEREVTNQRFACRAEKPFFPLLSSPHHTLPCGTISDHWHHTIPYSMIPYYNMALLAMLYHVQLMCHFDILTLWSTPNLAMQCNNRLWF